MACSDEFFAKVSQANLESNQFYRMRNYLGCR